MDRNRMASRVIRARIPPDGSQYLGDSAELQDNRGAAGITETPRTKPNDTEYRVRIETSIVVPAALPFLYLLAHSWGLRDVRAVFRRT